MSSYSGFILPIKHVLIISMCMFDNSSLNSFRRVIKFKTNTDLTIKKWALSLFHTMILHVFLLARLLIVPLMRNVVRLYSERLSTIIIFLLKYVIVGLSCKWLHLVFFATREKFLAKTIFIHQY